MWLRRSCLPAFPKMDVDLLNRYVDYANRVGWVREGLLHSPPPPPSSTASAASTGASAEAVGTNTSAGVTPTSAEAVIATSSAVTGNDENAACTRDKPREEGNDDLGGDDDECDEDEDEDDGPWDPLRNPVVVPPGVTVQIHLGEGCAFGWDTRHVFCGYDNGSYAYKYRNTSFEVAGPATAGAVLQQLMLNVCLEVGRNMVLREVYFSDDAVDADDNGDIDNAVDDNGWTLPPRLPRATPEQRALYNFP